MRAFGASRLPALCVAIFVLSTISFAACPCTLFGPNGVPGAPDQGENAALELGTIFSSTTNGYITGIRFYKMIGNTGIHVGNLWAADGTLLASAQFTVETPTGWQQVNFATPVPITANTAYTASYHTNTGQYAFDYNYFTSPLSNPPLQAPVAAGVYAYSSTTAFPHSSYSSGNYWVDVVFTTSLGPDVTPPTVLSTSPGTSGTGIALQPTVSAIFSESLNAASITTSTFILLDPSGTQLGATVSYSTSSRTATLVPKSPLSNATTYTAVLKSSVSDTSGNTLGSDYSWHFTTLAAYNQGPGGPILVLTSSSNPFSSYYAEILRAEGFNEFAMLDVSQLNSALLTQYQIVILGDFPLTASTVSILTNWVNSGGFLIAMHPDKQLAGLLGLKDANATLANAYLQVSTGNSPGAGIIGTPIQFHGSADLYTLNGAATVATLFSNATTSTDKPAVTLYSVGNGAAAAFTYDLAKSVALTRQGNPAWAGQARDGLSPVRPDDLFFGAASFDPEPDYVDLNNIAIPQADEQQRLLGNLMLTFAFFDQPLPRFWYFPHGYLAAVVMTGDDHANGGTTGRFDKHIADSTAGCSVDDWQCIRSTSYIYPRTPITPAQVTYYTTQGFEISLHVQNQCIDYTSFSDLDRWYQNMLGQFISEYPGDIWPSTERTHCSVFSDYDTHPKVQGSHQIRYDTNYYYYPPNWVLNRAGFYTGSGMPMRYTALDGSMVDVYQAPTFMDDEANQTYPDTAVTMLNNAVGPLGFYAAITTNMHTDFAVSAACDAIISTAQSRGVPVISALQMLRWLDGRNTSSFNSFNWNGYILAFTENSGPNTSGIMAMLPSLNAVGTLSGITVNGAPVTYSTQTIKGVSYAMFNAVSGGNYQATYSGLSSITFSPSSVGGGTSSTGTVTLNGPAPASGAKVNLMSGSGIVTVPAFVNVLAGATTATFIATTQSVSSTTPVTITGSYGGVTVTGTLTVTTGGGQPTLTSIAVTPANPTITVGGTQPFTATGTYSDSSTQNLTSQVTWASSKTSVATISAAGVATGTATGTSTVSAKLGSITGSTVLTVSPATLVSIAVTPANPSIAAGNTQPFTATGTYSDTSTQNITSQVAWASDNAGVATINSAGTATGKTVGSANISATLGSVSGGTKLSVTAATLVSIAVTPANPSIAVGGTQPFTATGTYTDSSTQNLTAQVMWASSKTNVATITTGGVASGKATGTSTISATLGSVTGSTVLTITAATLVSIGVTPANPSIAAGNTQPFTATGTYSDTSTQNLTSQVTWGSSKITVATITAAGIATGKATGTSTISATLGSVTGSTVLTVTPALLVSIAVTPANPIISAGSTLPFTATGTYTDSSTQNLTSTATWSSSTTSVATINTAGLATAVALGSTTIKAVSGSISGTTTLSVGTAGISFANGFSSNGLALNGSATINTGASPDRLRLTARTTNQAGSAWFTTPQNIQTFTNDFSFALSSGSSIADGFTFVIQNAGTSALGPSGGGLGYGPGSPGGTASNAIKTSVAVKFDVYSNAGEGTDSTGLYTNGASPTTPAISLGSAIDLHSGHVMNVHMTYVGTTLTMTITDVPTAKTFTTSWTVNIPSVVGGNTAYVGFTGGTGGQTAIQEILTWDFSNSVPTPVTYQTSKLVVSTSGPSVQSLSYSGFPDGTGTLFNSTKATDRATFTVNVATPGTYDVQVSYRAANSYGTWQLAINGSNVGPLVDEYQSSTAYAVADLGTFNFSSAGSYSFRFTVGKKNASSSGFKISFDDFILTPQ